MTIPQVVGQLTGTCGTNTGDPCDDTNNATMDGAFAAYFSVVDDWLNDPGGGGGGPCTSCDEYTGTLSGTGDYDYHPGGTYYYSGSGTHRGWLEGPSGTDFDLYLWKWSGSGWSTVAQSTSSDSEEEITYSGSSGYYVWRIYSYSGSGSYTFWLDRP